MKKLELDLYDGAKEFEFESGHGRKPMLWRGGSSIKSYITKPSTHGGLYLAGVGWLIGGVGYFVKEIAFSLYSDGPEIVSKLLGGAWQEVVYHVATSVTKSILTAAYASGAGGAIGYIGGSIITGNVWDSLTSFFSSKKRNGR